MKRRNKISILVVMGLILSVQAFAQKEIFNPVYTGVTSLSIAPDSRAGAMGDVGCATDPYMDNNSQYWNPSKYPFTLRAGEGRREGIEAFQLNVEDTTLTSRLEHNL